MKIECKELSFAYDRESIIDRMSLDIKPGQLTSIAGPNGIGKSTLIKCLCNIYQPKKGRIYLNGREIASMDARELAKTLGYVPQKQIISFSMTVYEIVLLGRRPYIKWKVTRKDELIVEQILEKLNIIHLAERDVDTLSGGEKQKVAIARALAQEPEIFFLDEPTSSLDLNHQVEVMEILRELAYLDQSTVIAVLHDLNLASSYSDQIYLLGDTGIHAAGSPEEVFTKGIIKDVYGIDVEIINTVSGSYIIPIKSKDKSSHQPEAIMEGVS